MQGVTIPRPVALIALQSSRRVTRYRFLFRAAEVVSYRPHRGAEAGGEPYFGRLAGRFDAVPLVTLSIVPNLPREDRDQEQSPLPSTLPERFRPDVLWAASAAALVAVAFVVGHLHLGIVTPLVNATPLQRMNLVRAAPLLARWRPHASWGTPAAILIAVLAIGFASRIAAALSWRALTFVVWFTSAAWSMALAMIDGWKRGFATKLSSPTDYLVQVHRVTGISSFLRHFASNIGSGHSVWNIQVAAHPPGALLTFVELHRLGLGAPVWASAFCVFAGSSAAMAIVIAVRAISDEQTARHAAPFLAIGPAAIWIAVSADAYFGAVAAWGLALLALAASRRVRFPGVASVGAGLVLGCSVFLDYGLALMVIPAVAIMFGARNFRPLLGAVSGVLVVSGAFASLGFWWLTGLDHVRHLYAVGISRLRPYAYWVWGDLAALVCATGLAPVAGIHRAFDRTALKKRSPLALLIVSFCLVIVIADLSGLSKAETERIWLPFAFWLVAAPALLPARTHRFWLAVQILAALAINSLLITVW